jgi:hypothetical protein
MLQLTDENLSRVQDLCRVLPPWKRGEFLQELTRRMQGRELNRADLRREAAREGKGPASYTVPVSGSRVSYRLRDLAAWVEAHREDF